MRVLFASFVLLSAPALAQGSPDAPAGPSATARSHMAMTGLVVSAGSLVLAGSAGAPEILLAAPLASGTAVYVVGEVLGHDGNAFATLGAAAAGGAVGYALLVLNRGALGDQPSDAEIAGFVLGIATYAVLPSLGATAGYTVSARPTALAAPGGGVAPGLSLRLGL